MADDKKDEKKPAPAAAPTPKKPAADPLRVWDALEALASAQVGQGGALAPLWRDLANAIREQLGDEPIAVSKPATGSALAIAPLALPPARGDIVGIARQQSPRVPAAAAPVPKTGRERQSFEKPITTDRRRPQ